MDSWIHFRKRDQLLSQHSESHRAGLQGTQLCLPVQELLKTPLLFNVTLLFTSSSSVLQSYVAKILHTKHVAAAIINCYTLLLTARTRVSSGFYGCQTLLPSENFLIQWTKLSGVRDTALFYGSWLGNASISQLLEHILLSLRAGLTNTL